MGFLASDSGVQVRELRGLVDSMRHGDPRWEEVMDDGAGNTFYRDSVSGQVSGKYTSNATAREQSALSPGYGPAPGMERGGVVRRLREIGKALKSVQH